MGYLETLQWANITFIFRNLRIERHPSLQLLRKLAEEAQPCVFPHKGGKRLILSILLAFKAAGRAVALAEGSAERVAL